MNSWEVEQPKKCITECGHLKDMDKHKIVLSSDVWLVIRAMLHKHPSDEWQMMLTGTIEKDTCLCTGYYITKQEVSSALVTNKDCVDKAMIEEKHIVAGIHSHVNMGTTPSVTDIEDSVMSLIDYHLIVNNKREVNAMRKALLPCGSPTILSCDCLIENAVDLDKVEIVGLENITKKVYTYQGHAYPDSTTNRTIWERFGAKAVTYPSAKTKEEYDDEKLAEQLMAYGGY